MRLDAQRQSCFEFYAKVRIEAAFATIDIGYFNYYYSVVQPDNGLYGEGKENLER